MAKIKIILDKRRALQGEKYPIKIYIYHRAQQMLLSTDITASLAEWDENAGLFLAKDAQSRAKNARLRDMMARCETLLLTLTLDNSLQKMTAKALRERVMTELCIQRRGGSMLLDYLEKAKEGKAERTRRLFTWAQQRVTSYDERVLVTDIDKAWVERFRDSMIDDGYAPNTVAQGIAWVSRALSLAVADGLITQNPCAGVRKPKAETRKKYLPLEKLRELRDMSMEQFAVRFNPERVTNLEYARDMFMLQFYLLGINVADLMELREIVDGRVEYRRCKTKTLYSVKVQPEALEIIERWRGVDRLLWNPCSTATSLCSTITMRLQDVMPGVSTNWARHTWASIAAELEIPIETISHALGHKIGSPVTAIYVAYNQKKVDDANRRVIDYINADLRAKAGK